MTRLVLKESRRPKPDKIDLNSLGSARCGTTYKSGRNQHLIQSWINFFSGVGGYEGDGDIFREDNLVEFRKFVIENSDNKGVHFVMADGVCISLKEMLFRFLSNRIPLVIFTSMQNNY